jgi:hypothetical protein
MSPFRLVKVLPTQLNADSQQHLMTKTGRRHNVLHSLEPVTKLMGLLGIPIPASMEVSSCRLTCHLYSTFCFLTVMSIQSIQVINIIYNAKDVSMVYCLSGLSSSALSWNLIIESLNLALYAVGSQICLLLLTRSKTWTDLINSFKLLEENLPSNNIFASCRKFTIKVIIYIFFPVCIFCFTENPMIIKRKH